MTTGNTDSSVTLTFRVREQVTTSMARVESSLNRVSNASATTAKFMARNATTFATAGLATLTAASAVSRLGTEFGLLNQEQADTVSKGLLVGSAVFGIAGAVGSLGQLLQQSGAARGIGQLTTKLAGLGAPTVLVGVVALTSAIAALVTVMQLLSGQETTLERFTNVNLGGGNRFQRVGNLLSQATPAGLAAGGSRFGGRNGIGTQGINVAISTFAATETELRGAAKTIGRILQEESRIGGFKVN